VLRVAAYSAAASGDPPGYAAALIDAMESVRQADGAGAARGVLQAARSVVAFDWAVALRYDTAAVEAVAVYPSGLTGIDAGARWAAADAADRQLVASGQPTLDGELRTEPGDQSPLSRLPSFGMRSAMRVPLFRGPDVVGCVAVYAATPAAFRGIDGVRLERLVRALGDRVAAARREVVAPPLPTELPTSEVMDTGEDAQVAIPVDEPRETPVADDARVVAERMERLNALGELVSGVAHELNNPLTAILGYAQMLPALDSTERNRALSTIEDEALRASRIVRNLLSFARQHRPRIEAVDLNALLERIVDVRRYSLSVDNVEVILELGELSPVPADEYQLEQVFLNLLSNAHQAVAPAGSGTVTIRTTPMGDRVRVAVTDTGPGIPEELKARIFEPFFSTREVGRGSGMGLAIVFGVVTEHGGRVWVEQAPSGGARFVVELPTTSTPPEIPAQGAPPLPPEQPAAGAASSTDEPPSTASDSDAPGRLAPESPRGEPPTTARVLVVDDEAPIRALIREILAAAGHAATLAASGNEALRLLEAQAFDVVLLDVRMPGMDGLSLYGRIVQQWPQMRGRVVFVTGEAGGEHVAGIREGDERYLEKPFHRTELLRMIDEVLAQP
jgi:signal transduction histidine kinase